MLFDFADLAPRDRYKLMASTILPRPIAWVVTESPEGRRNAAPFSFFNMFSDDPPVVCLGIGARAGDPKDTARNIRETGQFVVNLVSEAVAERMNVTAIEFGPEVDELAEAGLETAPSVKVRPPRIACSPVALECERMTILELGPSRSLVVGQVLAMHIHDDAVLDAAKCYVDTPKLGLVARMHGRGWYARSTDLFDMPRIDVADWRERHPAQDAVENHSHSD
ncbi:flavin reductase family protein [Azospirillum sp. RWY-5-1]|uniref:Flavin reductase family protein n=1 Tax=Azospirillum oleiclasticum TaxID=2735135 RepID=A0ABX2TLR5_9PROT|nr:flavin reductase family protein [Azospirillum oleiclasticum]NYZ16498.1 flavin reductase family protein [Azospirillum oleiclasticum]NYZ24033.1 flavin reductase family protein [Azospirillum oleiclasticum]